MMTGVSLFRLYALRALYLFMFGGLVLAIWPQWRQPAGPFSFWHGVVASLLTAISLMALLGVRYPLKMLPLLFFELTWKAIWLAGIALPLWLGHRLDADTAATVPECLLGVLVPIVLPWRYVWETYLRAPADRWRTRPI